MPSTQVFDVSEPSVGVAIDVIGVEALRLKILRRLEVVNAKLAASHQVAPPSKLVCT